MNWEAAVGVGMLAVVCCSSSHAAVGFFGESSSPVYDDDDDDCVCRCSVFGWAPCNLGGVEGANPCRDMLVYGMLDSRWELSLFLAAKVFLSTMVLVVENEVDERWIGAVVA